MGLCQKSKKNCYSSRRISSVGKFARIHKYIPRRPCWRFVVFKLVSEKCDRGGYCKSNGNSISLLDKLFEKMNLTGLLVGLSTFLIIGLFHPLVVKAEYYIGVKSWVLFAIAGVAFAIASVLIDHMICSIIMGVVAFSSFWSILEVVHQRERVRKGWFPEGPGHKK